MALPFNFDPGQVLMGRGSGKNALPYMSNPDAGTYGGAQKMSGNDPSLTVPAQNQPQTTLGPESVRASGSGPFDPTYRQNLATYAGGQFSRPGGSLTFDPTGSLFGNPTGAGNAPVMGTGTGLLDQALGGQPFSYAPPAPQGPSTPDASNPMQGWQDWINQFRNQGNGFALQL